MSRLTAAVLAASVTALAGCASAQMTTLWKDPELGKAPFRKVAIFAAVKDEGIFRATEDAFVRAMQGSATQAVAGYQLVPAADRGDSTKVRSGLEQAGVDGVIVYRYLGKTMSMDYQPGSGPYAGGVNGYYGYAMANDPGYLAATTTYYLGTAVYAVNPQKLLWTARSQSFAPKDVGQVIDELVKMSVAQMKTDGVVK